MDPVSAIAARSNLTESGFIFVIKEFKPFKMSPLLTLKSYESNVALT